MKQNKSVKNTSMGRSLATGVIVSMVVTFLCAGVSAAMVISGWLAEGMKDYIAMAVLFLAALVGAATGARKTQERRLYICALVAVTYLAILLAMTALFFGGQYEGVAVTAFVLLSGAIVSAVAGKGRVRGGNLRRSKIKRR